MLYFFAFLQTNLHAAIINVPISPASIQSYINAANPGDTLQLATSRYEEEILITKDLTIKGNGQGLTIIQCPTTPSPLTNSFIFTPTATTYHPIVMAQNAEVTIQDLTVDGNNLGSSNSRFVGVGYHNAGGTIQNVHSTNIEDSYPAGGAQHGTGILGAVDGGIPYTLNVLNCTVDRFQKTGMDMRGNFLTANITGNTITGQSPPNLGLATANGIQVSRGALGVIDSNTITNMISLPGNDSVGILLVLAASANCSVTNNICNGNDIAIYSSTSGNNLTILNNIVNTSSDIGIYVENTTGTSTIQNNILTDNSNYNMFLYDSSGNNAFQLGQNQFIGAINGLGVQGNVSTGPVVTMNADSFTGTTGYFIEETTAPNDIWPSTSNVSFNGLVSGHITFAEYTAIRTQILDKLSPVLNPALGLVLDFIAPSPPTLTSLSQSSGSPAGGNTITITGTNFLSSNTTVSFGSTPGINVVVVSDTTITVTVPAGSGIVEVTVTTPFGTSSIVPAGEYTYNSAILPPASFTGVIIKNKFFNKTEYILTSSWEASPSADVVLYRIYHNGQLVKEVSSLSLYVFVTCLISKEAAHNYSITAVNSANLESAPTPIRIVRV